VAGTGTLPVQYEVELTNLTSGAVDLSITVPDPTHSTVTQVQSTSYRLRVRACQAGCGPWSATVQFGAVIAPVPASAPTITSAVVNGSNSATIQWTAVSGAEWYQLFVIQPAPAGPGGSALTVAARQVVGTSVSGLALPSGAANAIVAACTGNGCGPYSAAVGVTPAGPNPSAPQLGQPLAGSVVAGPGVMFTWSRVPGDTGSNTTYRLYVQDLSRQATALDVLTTNNFYAASFKAAGAQYDAVVVANPGPSQMIGPAVGFNVRGSSPTAPTLVEPTHNGTVAAGNIEVGWTPVTGATLYEYFVAVQGQGTASATGVTPGLVVQVPLAAVNGQPTLYNAIARACPAGVTCQPGTDTNWGPWSSVAGTGVISFTATP
jgi:hypothetical protein